MRSLATIPIGTRDSPPAVGPTRAFVRHRYMRTVRRSRLTQCAERGSADAAGQDGRPGTPLEELAGQRVLRQAMEKQTSRHVQRVVRTTL